MIYFFIQFGTREKNALAFGLIIPYLLSIDEIVVGARCCAQGRSCLLLQTPDAITDEHLVYNVQRTNIRKEPMWRVDDCFILFMVVSFITGYVIWKCQSFLSDVSFCCFFLSTVAFGLVVMGFDLSLPVGDGYFLAR